MIKVESQYRSRSRLLDLRYTRHINLYECLNTALAVDYLITQKDVLPYIIVRSQYRSRSRLLDQLGTLGLHTRLFLCLNTALAVDYLIKFSINRLETIAKSRKSKNLLNATKITLFAKNFANVLLLFVQIRHFSHPSNRYMPEYGFITI